MNCHNAQVQLNMKRVPCFCAHACTSTSMIRYTSTSASATFSSRAVNVDAGAVATRTMASTSGSSSIPGSGLGSISISELPPSADPNRGQRTIADRLGLQTNNDKCSVFLLDGGTGEELFRQGMPDDRKIWSAAAVVHPKYHSILKNVHRSFVNAGSQAITTNSYGIVPAAGFNENEIAKYVAIAGRLARESVSNPRPAGEDSNDTTPTAAALVFGSLGPLNESYRPDLILPHDEGVRIYSIMVKSLQHHVDCFLAETMSSYEESIQAVQAVAKTMAETGSVGDDNIQAKSAMLVSYTLNSEGDLRSREPAVDAVKKLLAFAKRHNIDILGVLFNCSEPEAITTALKHLHDDNSLQLDKLLLGAYANRLTPVADDWTMEESEGPQPMRNDLAPEIYCNKFVSKWVSEYNVWLVGGCCGIEPAHIQHLRDHFSKK